MTPNMSNPVHEATCTSHGDVFSSLVALACRTPEIYGPSADDMVRLVMRCATDATTIPSQDKAREHGKDNDD